MEFSVKSRSGKFDGNYVNYEKAKQILKETKYYDNDKLEKVIGITEKNQTHFITEEVFNEKCEPVKMYCYGYMGSANPVITDNFEDVEAERKNAIEDNDVDFYYEEKIYTYFELERLKEHEGF